ncbi:Uncharacterized conserved protein, DUF2147 family [Aliiroseovarius sediminilitoris]|uniref:Uncharacterized conserved protein, DUF2147 family n=1 Tax=Aliiroseovarius sediminilitoris TaxID=1173584 RepID=A0A1I0NSH2_9RHOB|nr:DUF2147 domain-containing protein [Aliiroseovarius sediminilitoris]SEW04604.1 Uncharacterized conserved protein, DUF2147 family [Aliiroseovarius sediminilitoris]
MKRMVLALALSFGMAAPALADAVEGVWKTQVDDGAYAHVTISQCGSALCGVISRTFKDSGEYKSENIGKKLVWDMQPNGGGRYSGGKIWQPSTGKVFKSKMTLSGSSLKVEGCVAVFCKKQTWSRVK